MEQDRYQLLNPFVGSESYHCFACAPHNHRGLKLQFWRDKDTIIAIWHPDADYQGYPHIVHGGIQATLVDEAGSWALYALQQIAGMTTNMEIAYQQPLPLTEQPIETHAVIHEVTNKNCIVRACIYASTNTIATTATITYRIIPERLAKKMYLFPDPAAFHPDGALS